MHSTCIRVYHTQDTTCFMFVLIVFGLRCVYLEHFTNLI